MYSVPSGPLPAPIEVVSTGRKRSPPAPVGSSLTNLIRTGWSFCVTMKGPRKWIGATSIDLPAASRCTLPAASVASWT